MGERQLKNIARPIRVYDVRPDGTPAQQTLTKRDKPSIAVLPFQNLSGDPEQEYFADGIVEDIITSLSKVPHLFVIARNSTFTYKNKAVDVRQVARELNVQYVLEGSVRRSGDRLRVTAQLRRATISGLSATTGQYVTCLTSKTMGGTSQGEPGVVADAARTRPAVQGCR